MHTNHTRRPGSGFKDVRKRFRARRETFHKLSRVVEMLALLALARRIGLRRGRRLVALATMAFLDERAHGRHDRAHAGDRR